MSAQVSASRSSTCPVRLLGRASSGTSWTWTTTTRISSGTAAQVATSNCGSSEHRHAGRRAGRRWRAPAHVPGAQPRAAARGVRGDLRRVGGWYDDVRPPAGRGFRVPALLGSAYARRGVVDSTSWSMPPSSASSSTTGACGGRRAAICARTTGPARSTWGSRRGRRRSSGVREHEPPGRAAARGDLSLVRGGGAAPQSPDPSRRPAAGRAGAVRSSRGRPEARPRVRTGARRRPGALRDSDQPSGTRNAVLGGRRRALRGGRERPRPSAAGGRRDVTQRARARHTRSNRGCAHASTAGTAPARSPRSTWITGYGCASWTSPDGRWTRTWSTR